MTNPMPNLTLGLLAGALLAVLLFLRSRPKDPEQQRLEEDHAEIRRIGRHAMELGKTDKAAAQRYLEAAMAPRLERRRRERESLRDAATRDSAAASRYRALLQDDMRTHEFALKSVAKEVHRGKAEPFVLEDIHTAIAETKKELDWLQQYSNQGS